jgi:SAM-dependent methyltransferase
MNLAPIILFVYNRPLHTEQTLVALEKNEFAQDSILYIYSDGVKDNVNDEENNKIQEVRTLIKKNWKFKKIHIVERDKNWGLAENVIDGITKMFGEYNKIIVLEDDIITSPNFISYMNNSLYRYEDEVVVKQISAFAFDLDIKKSDSAYFMPLVTTWGWATWKRVWDETNFNPQDYLELKTNDILRERFNIDGTYDYSSMLISQMESENISSWGIRFWWNVFRNKGLVLHPDYSLVQNIGFDNSGVHCGESDFSTTKEWLPNCNITNYPSEISIEQNNFKKLKIYFKRNLEQPKPKIGFKNKCKRYSIMVKKIIKKVFGYYSKQEARKVKLYQNNIKERFFKNGQIPWSEGYENHKKESISESIFNDIILDDFSKKKIPKNYGYRLDERIVEYPWIFANLKKGKTVFLDAGSTFNFAYLLNNKLIENKDKYIYTFYPENKSYNHKRISYVYGDLRDLPFRDNFFEEIVCQSTIEHVDMDNSMYGYDLKSTLELVTNKSYEYLKVIEELLRVLKTEGQLLLTFPYGKFENHVFFQQFDDEMVARITDKMKDLGSCELTFFKYLPDGWIVASQEECNNLESFNPHTQIGKKDDFAAHSRAICCVKFIQTK